MILLLILGVIIYLVSARKIDGHPFSAMGLFGAVWLSSLSLYTFNFVGYIGLSWEAKVIIFLTIFSFTIGALTYSIIVHLSKRAFHNTTIQDYQNYPKNGKCVLLMRKLVAGMDIILISVVLWRLFFVASATGIKLSSFLTPGYGIYLEITETPLLMNYFTLLGIPAIAISTVLSLVSRKWTDVIFVVVPILALSIIGIKSYLFYGAVWGTFVYIYFQSYYRKGKWLLLGIMVIVFLLLFFIGYSFMNGDLSNNGITGFFNALKMPYIYASGSIPAFSNFIDQPRKDYLIGVMTLRPIYRFMQETFYKDLPIPSHMAEYTLIPFSFNTYTFLREFYIDWGPAGLLVIMWVLGYSLSWLFHKMKTERSLKLLLIVSLTSMWIVFSPLTNQFVMPKHWAFLFISISLGHWFDKKFSISRSKE